MRENFNWRYEIIVASLLFIAIAIGKANIIDLPYYWDEMCAYINPTHWLNQGSLLRALPGLHPPHTFYGHPFALYSVLAVIYRIFGETIVVSHIFILFIVFIGLYYTYLLGKYIHNRSVGLIASLLLFFSPLYFAQSGMVNGDVVITSLGVITIYYFLKRSYVPFLISGIFLVLTKESAIAFIAAMIIYLCIEDRKRPTLYGDIIKYSVPLIVILVFFSLQKITTGMILPNEYFGTHSFFESNMTALFNKLKLISNWIFIHQYRVVLLIIIIINLIINKKRALNREYILFGILFLFFIGAYSGIFFLARYILPVLPFFCIMAAASIVMLFAYKKVYFAVAMIVIASFVTGLHGHGDSYASSETDMQYIDIVSTHKEACKYSELNFTNKRVLTNQPLSTNLRAPFLGYVSRPQIVTEVPAEGYDVVMYSRQSDRSTAVVLENIIARDRLSLLKRFELNGKAVEIYANTRNYSYNVGPNILDLYDKFKVDKDTVVTKIKDGVLFNSKTNDPRILLPSTLDGKNKSVKIVINSSCDTYVQLYYQTQEMPTYTETLSIKHNIVAGANTINISISDDKARGQLRLDPGARQGKYIINSLQISDF